MKFASLLVAVLLAATPPGETHIGSNAQDGDFVVRGAWNAPSSAGPITQAVTRYETRRIEPMFCGTRSPGSDLSLVPCVDDTESASALRQCADGSRALGPLMRRLVDETGAPLSGWEQVDNGGCPEDPDPGVVLTAEEFRRLPLAPAVPVVQPSDGRALINLGVAVHTDGSPQELATTVVGVPVQVRATPVGFSWDFGDGTVVTTRSAGASWPDHAALGEYPDPGEYELRLTTTWRGEFRANGAGPWLPVSGTATTTSAPIPITVETAPSRLVADR